MKSYSLGKGAFGDINFGLNKKTKEYVEIKNYNDNDMKCFNNEVSNLKKLEKYNFFPKIIGYDNSNKNNLYFVQTLKGPNLFFS